MGCVENILENYIQNNHGRFPQKQDDLEKEGFLRKISDSGTAKYQIKGSNGWFDFEFENYLILYGAKPESFSIKEDMYYRTKMKVLVDIQTKQPVLLLDTIERKKYDELIVLSNRCSIDLYNAMLKAQKTEEAAK